MIRKFAFAGAVAALAMAAGSASAAIVTSFTPGGASPGAGYTVIDTFDTTFGLIGSGFQIKTPPSDSNGAPPANSVPAGTPYLSVLGGGHADILFSNLTSATVTSFEFDWGSIDSYNSLVIHSSTGKTTIVPGTGSFPNAANGNQFLPGTNGLFKVWGTEGETFQGIVLNSSQNSFEVDNLAIAGVPEPTTWAMMLVGLGALGGALRNRRKAVAACA